jgi:hypothetical protein
VPGALVLRRQDWREGCERCKQILRYGGMGHTMSIHSRDEDVILQFGLHKPAFRIVVNSPTTHGSIGLTTGLDPALTLGCGGFGGNITSDNISAADGTCSTSSGLLGRTAGAPGRTRDSARPSGARHRSGARPRVESPGRARRMTLRWR